MIRCVNFKYNIVIIIFSLFFRKMFMTCLFFSDNMTCQETVTWHDFGNHPSHSLGEKEYFVDLFVMIFGIKMV